jgi:hypothetical protein
MYPQRANTQQVTFWKGKENKIDNRPSLLKFSPTQDQRASSYQRHREALEARAAPTHGCCGLSPMRMSKYNLRH